MILTVLKSGLLAMRSALWFRPALFSLSAALLAVLVAMLDRLSGLPPLAGIEGEAVASLLRFAAGGMLTITTVTLSVLMLVLSIAAGQASPRSVPELMADSVTQNSLGTFLGTLVFALTAQALMEFGAVEGIGVTAAFLLALLLVATAIGQLIRWIHHVADSLKLNRIVAMLHRQAQKVLDAHFDQDWEVATADQADGGTDYEIAAEKVGYVELIDVARLDACAKEQGLRISLTVREGDFVQPGAALMTVRSESLVDTALQMRLCGLVTVGAERSPERDPLLGFELLSEVACRALSPGINDPQTAIVCIDHLAALLARPAATAPHDYPPQRSPSGRVELVPVGFSAMLKRAVRPVARDGAGCAEVVCALLTRLGDLAERAAPDHMAPILAEAEAAAELGDARLTLDRDKAALSEQLAALRATVQRRATL